MDIDKFEKFLLNKRKFISDMLLVLHNDSAVFEFEVQLELLDAIIHHFNVFVKGEMSSGLGEDDG